MNVRKSVLALMITLLCFGFAADSYADISNAAVLFLRIAPGSRAAGMGEAFVAIADDATATHWNPAGLGNQPLSSSWEQGVLPQQYGTLRGVAALKSSGSGLTGYDLWQITGKGIVRYDHKNWYTYEEFDTKTNETVVQKVQAYFYVKDEKRLARIVAKVAEFNNDGEYSVLEKLRDDLLSAIPESHDDRAQIVTDLDSLLPAYGECRVNWSRVNEARERLTDGMKDSTLSGDEIIRISLALERARARFLPEVLKIPYNALFDGLPTAITSSASQLLVAGPDGLARYSGNVWRLLTTADGLPSTNISAVHPIGSSIIIATDSGTVRFSGLALERLTTPENDLPPGDVQSVGGNGLTKLYAVVDGELFHYDGRTWSNTAVYTVVLGDTPERLAEKFSLYGTESDRRLFQEKFNAIATVTEPKTPTPSVLADSTKDVDETIEAESKEMSEATGERMTPGDEINVPLVASIKGRTTAIFVNRDGLWLGTEYGVFKRTKRGWEAPGYSKHTVTEGETIESLVAARQALNQRDFDSDIYIQQLIEVNDLDAQGTLTPGQQLMIYKMPAAGEIRSIGASEGLLYVGTDQGLIEFNGVEWESSSMRGLDDDAMVDIINQADEVWFASDRKIVSRGRANTHISLMHVKWLPELADDLYYEFLGFVTQIEGWGTVGGNITFISYGKFNRTNEGSPEIVGEFESFDIALTLSYGAALNDKLRGGISAKVIHSRLSPLGTGLEQGTGYSTGFAIDLGLLYLLSSRLTLGMAVTNLGPEMSYIDAAQSDDLPRNLAIGFAYKLLRSDYNSLIVTAEVNKLLVGLDDRAREELQQLVINSGAEFSYADLFSFRAGYIYDQEGQIKTFTIGAGLKPLEFVRFDFAYIPSQSDFSLANTLRVSLGIML